MPKSLQDWRKDDYNYFTGKASDNARYLALAGIAIIWLFKETSPNGDVSLPNDFIPTLFWLCISLAFDFTQYVVGGIVWGCFLFWAEKKVGKNELNENDIKANKILPNIIRLFYWGKLICLGIAYYKLINYFITYFNISELPT